MAGTKRGESEGDKQAGGGGGKDPGEKASAPFQGKLRDRPPFLGSVTGQPPSATANCRWLKVNRQRMEPNDLGGVGETSPHTAPSKGVDTSTKPELNHAQSTTRESSAHGKPDLRPQTQKYTADTHLKSHPLRRVMSQMTHTVWSVHTETASRSDSDSFG